MNAVDNELTGFNLSQGRSSGDTFRRVNGWIKGLFNRADYEKTSNHKGYKADNDGLVAGIDGMVSDTVKLGAGYSFISSDIKSGGKRPPLIRIPQSCMVSISLLICTLMQSVLMAGASINPKPALTAMVWAANTTSIPSVRS